MHCDCVPCIQIHKNPAYTYVNEVLIWGVYSNGDLSIVKTWYITTYTFTTYVCAEYIEHADLFTN